MKIIAANALPEFRLNLRFDSGESGVVDLSSLVGRGVFAAWNQPGLFEKVTVTDYGAVEWPGDIDLCPDALYLQMTGKKVEELFPVCEIDSRMPEVSRFYGIVIQMYFGDHPPPHFHALYGEHSAKVDIDSLSVMAGRLPARVLGLVTEWAATHQQELREAFERAANLENPGKIDPLD